MLCFNPRHVALCFLAAPECPETPATSNGPKEQHSGETEQSRRELRKAWSEVGVVGMGVWRVYTHMHSQKVAGPRWQMVKLTFQQFLSFMSGLGRTYTFGGKKGRRSCFLFEGGGGGGGGVVGSGEGVRYSTVV